MSATAAARQRSWHRLWPGAALIAVICLGVAANLWPSLLHFQRYGTVPAVQRAAGDADFYGLRIAQLLRFVSDAPRAHPPNDFRELVFGVQNFRLTRAQPPFATSMQSARGTHE